MSETIAAIPGFNVEQLEGFAAYAAENPTEVIIGTEATTIWEGHAGRSLAKIGPWSLAEQPINKPTRDYSLQIGAWKEVEAAIGVDGAHDKLEPVEVALAALCSCVTWAICITAAREGVSFETLTVTARGNLDPRVLLGARSTEFSHTLVQNIQMDIRVTGDVSDEDRVRIIEMTKRSPVHAMVKYANDIQTNVYVD